MNEPEACKRLHDDVQFFQKCIHYPQKTYASVSLLRLQQQSILRRQELFRRDELKEGGA